MIQGQHCCEISHFSQNDKRFDGKASLEDRYASQTLPGHRGARGTAMAVKSAIKHARERPTWNEP
jgi:hypothetical protein